MSFLTTDLCDAHSESLQVASPMFKSYGGHSRFFGKVVTLKVFEDNTMVRTALSEPGEGKVLVIDGGGSLRCALVGDQIAALAVDNRWSGIIVYGCIRDSVAINKLPLGVRALNTHPLKSVKRGVGERDLTLHFADVRFHPNDYVYADEDGVIVSPSALW